MSAYPFASAAKVTETLGVLGASNIASTQQTLLQQILAACSASSAQGPATPTGFTATPGNRRITLTWTTQPEADTFEIKFATVNNIVSASILTSSATGTSFVFDSGESIQSGEKYFFWIKASNSEGASDFSSSITARSFVTVANGAGATLATPTGTWVLSTLFFGTNPLVNGLVVSPDSNTYEYIEGTGWINNTTFDPADDVPISGVFTFQNFSGGSFTFWNSEP